MTAQEQYDMLSAAQTAIKDLKLELLNKCVLCEECNKLYFKEEITIATRNVKQLVCLNPLTGGYLDSYNYQEQDVKEYCRICPEGHQIGKYTHRLNDIL